MERGLEFIRECALNPQAVSTVELAAVWKRLHGDIERTRQSGSAFSFETSLAGVFRCLFGITGLGFSQDMEELEYLFDQNNSDHSQTDGMEELLEYLKHEKIHTGVISNIIMSGAALKRSIDTLYPNNAFEFVLTSADFVLTKPAPYLFEVALKRLGVYPEDCVYCGDSEYCDVGGALGAGMVPVLYRNGAALTPWSDDKALTINSWRVLTDLLRKG